MSYRAAHQLTRVRGCLARIVRKPGRTGGIIRNRLSCLVYLGNGFENLAQALLLVFENHVAFFRRLIHHRDPVIQRGEVVFDFQNQLLQFVEQAVEGTCQHRNLIMAFGIQTAAQITVTGTDVINHFAQRTETAGNQARTESNTETTGQQHQGNSRQQSPLLTFGSSTGYDHALIRETDHLFNGNVVVLTQTAERFTDVTGIEHRRFGDFTLIRQSQDFAGALQPGLIIAVKSGRHILHRRISSSQFQQRLHTVKSLLGILIERFHIGRHVFALLTFENVVLTGCQRLIQITVSVQTFGNGMQKDIRRLTELIGQIRTDPHRVQGTDHHQHGNNQCWYGQFLLNAEFIEYSHGASGSVSFSDTDFCSYRTNYRQGRIKRR